MPASVLALLAVFALPAVQARAQGQDDRPTLPPVRIAVLVDESGSLDDAAVAREREAARIIAQGELSTQSVISVTGFASEDREAGLSPVDPVCPPTTLDSAQNRQSLADCIGRIARRKDGQGDETDHVNALRQAMADLTGPGVGDEPKIIFLLTDGKLNVAGSDSYGSALSGEDRTAAARQQLPGLLTQLREANIQVWPLGFGDVDHEQLNALASGSAQQSCGVQTPPPTATVIDGSGDLLAAMRNAFSSARCVGPGSLEQRPLAPGQSVELEVTIPPIASDSAILVFKRHPGITVEYLEPDGSTAPTSGTSADGSQFEVSGQNTEVESLRIVDPVPGTWKVRLTSPADAPELEVAATVIFQGAVRGALFVNPPSPAAGQEVDVQMQVRARKAPITDRESLVGLSFVVTLTGAGFDDVAVTLADDDGDGQYQGRLTVPADAAGDLRFSGSVTGIGVGGDTRTLVTRVRPGQADVRAALSLSSSEDGEVVIGTSVVGRAQVTNDSDRARRVRLEIADAAPGTVLAVEPATAELAPNAETVVDFGVTFAADTAYGANQARLRLVDADDPTVILAEVPVARTVVEAPTFWDWLRWVLLAVAGLVVAGLLILAARLRRRARSLLVRGLRAELYGANGVVTLLPLSTAGRVFRFVIVDDPSTGHGLGHAGPGPAYEVRRDGRGGLLVTDLSGAVAQLAIGDSWYPRGDAGPAMVIAERGSAGSPLSDPLVGVAPGPGGPPPSDPFGGPPPMPGPGPQPGPYGGGGAPPSSDPTRPVWY